VIFAIRDPDDHASAACGEWTALDAQGFSTASFGDEAMCDLGSKCPLLVSR